jgi:NADH:ubiquinone oxidoreductase subunit 3 (subunit A)
MGLVLIPLILILAAIGIFVLLIFIIARRIDSKKKETFEKRDY